MKKILKELSALFQPRTTQPVQLHYQLPPDTLIQQTLAGKQGELCDTGALCMSTGTFNGRCPQDKFIVHDNITANRIDWNNFNHPIEEYHFLQLKQKMLQYLAGREEVWVRDAFACAHPLFRLGIRVVNEQPAANLFCYNMFLRPGEHELAHFQPDWHILQAPGFKADPAVDGTRSEQFVLLSFTHKTILIGGTAYTGEIKKGIFTVLNYLLPYHHNVLSMHCSANMGAEGDVALFFGLSGTGKTTLSADSNRRLIGDDEHGWAGEEIFNFEGGCYAKTINLSADKEPAIYAAIRKGALVENTCFYEGTDQIDFSSDAITENTRASYPLHFINNAVIPSVGAAPKHIFFLTCDAYGVLPPVSRLSPAQAMYYFLSGYTAKIAGTETGITEPKATFSACFGAPFLPLHPAVYANLLGRKIKRSNVQVWMVNTGWTGGAYGTGKRMDLSVTRTIISAVLQDALRYTDFIEEPIFGLRIPKTCAGVDRNLLMPRNTWRDKDAYDATASRLAQLFSKNFEHYAEEVTEEVRMSAPGINLFHSQTVNQ